MPFSIQFHHRLPLTYFSGFWALISGFRRLETTEVSGTRMLYCSSHRAVLLVAYALLCSCTSMSGVQTRDAVCPHDFVWEAALGVVNNRSVIVKDKNQGLIETDWLEIPMPGRAVVASQEEVQDNKDRSRLILTVKRIDVENVTEDVTRVIYVEKRQRWAFQPGSRFFDWAETVPSEDVLRDVRSRLDAALKERGCSLT